MEIRCEGTAKIKHAVDGQILTVDKDELDWEPISSNERGMGVEHVYEATYENADFGTLTWTLTEYPSGIENYKSTSVNNHTLLTDFDYSLVHDVPSEEHVQAVIQEMVSWFHSTYEDPVHSMPYESSEGGYQYIRGGPFDASEVIADQFQNVPEELQEEAVEIIQADGTVDWVTIEKSDLYVEEGYFEENYIEDGSGEVEIDKAPEIPSVSPGISFKLDNSGKIALKYQGLVGKSEFAEIKDFQEMLIEVTDKILSDLQGTNAHTTVLDAAFSYNKTIKNSPLSIDQLYIRGIRFENALLNTKKLIETNELPELPEKVIEPLSSSLSIHGLLISSTARGRELLERVIPPFLEGFASRTV